VSARDDDLVACALQLPPRRAEQVHVCGMHDVEENPQESITITVRA
jgi:hypothetical protein